MGNSTVIEFNHDTMHEIFKSDESKLAFLKQLESQMNYGHPNYSWREDTSVIGGRVIFFSHRDDKPYKLFQDFKFKLNELKGAING